MWYIHTIPDEDVFLRYIKILSFLNFLENPVLLLLSGILGIHRKNLTTADEDDDNKFCR
jgi:hypothetical protein